MAQAIADAGTEKGERLKREGVVIRTYDIWKTYTMGDQIINAVSGVDVEIKRGEYVAIMGPSGSGKSTLMNLIGCLDTPSNGEYYLNGQKVSDLTDDELARIRNKEIGPARDRKKHTSELQSLTNLVCRLLLEKKKKKIQ